MITKTEAVVLKSMNYGDSSKIVTFYTRRFGKIKGIAKGARQMKSKFGAALEPISNVALVLYKKEQRELHLISQCDTIKSYKLIHTALDRMAVALSVLELVNQLTHEEEGHEALYGLLVESLDEINRAPKNFMNFLFAFELRSASLLGFSPSLDLCQVCGRGIDEIEPDGPVVFRLSNGAFTCGRCLRTKDALRIDDGWSTRPRGSDGHRDRQDEGRMRLSRGTLKALHRLSKARLNTISSLDLAGAAGNEIDGTLRLYLRQHFEGLKPLRALEILRVFSGVETER